MENDDLEFIGKTPDKELLKSMCHVLVRRFTSEIKVAIDIIKKLDNCIIKHSSDVYICKILKEYDSMYMAKAHALKKKIEWFLRSLDSCKDAENIQEYKHEFGVRLDYLIQTVNLTEQLYQQAKQLIDEKW